MKPREKATLLGINQLSEVELLALILQSGTRKEGVMVISQRLIDKYGGVTKLVNQSTTELMKNEGIGLVKAAKINAIKALSDILIQNESLQMQIISAEDVYLCTKKFASKKQEYLLVVSLNVQNRIVSIETVYQGTIDKIVLHPREILSSGIKNLAAKIILVHNHPSGNLIPSLADIKTTERLVQAANIIDLNISDHVIISTTGFYSMRENNLIDFN